MLPFQISLIEVMWIIGLIELTKHQGRLIIDCGVHKAFETNAITPKNQPVWQKQRGK